MTTFRLIEGPLDGKTILSKDRKPRITLPLALPLKIKSLDEPLDKYGPAFTYHQYLLVEGYDVYRYDGQT